MAASQTLLKWDLSRTLHPEEAGFSERNSLLRLFSTEIEREAASVFGNDPGRGFMNGRNLPVVFLDGKWVDTSSTYADQKDGLQFTKEGEFWKCEYGGNTIKIMNSCDQRDAAQWISSYIDTCTPASITANTRSKISEFKGITYELGSTVPNDPLAVAQAIKDTVYFYNHGDTQRLFCVALQDITSSPSFNGNTPTTISDVIVHECAHLLEGQLKKPIARMALSLSRALSGDYELFNEMKNAAMQVNDVYFDQLFCRTKIAIDCSNPEDMDFNILAGSDNIANEIAAEFLSRAVLGGQNLDRISGNRKAMEIFDMISKVPIEPENADPLEGRRRVFSTNFMPNFRTDRSLFERV